MADGRVIIEIDGDSDGFEESIQGVASGAVSELEDSLEGAQQAFDRLAESAGALDSAGLEAVSGAAGEVTDAASGAAGALGESEDAAEGAAAAMGDAGDAAEAAAGSLADTGDSAEGAASGLDDIVDSASEAADGLKDVDGAAKDAGEGLGETEKPAIGIRDIFKGNLYATIAAKGLELVAQAAMKVVGALIDLGKTAIQSYAEYEQVSGGAKLLWGDAYDFIAEKAATAYKDSGMSANDYLTTVNGYATALKEAMGNNSQAAAELASRIVTAQADVVAATGATQDAVLNAFNGIMKGNYTMMDNLQLGIKPTKEGFQELIDKVNDWNAANGRATDYSMDSLADQQAALVDYISMVGLAGYAAAEAGDTISGSFTQAKAAWDNLLTGMANPDADMGALVDQFVSAAETAMDNMIPVLSRIGEAAGPMLASLGTAIGEHSEELVGAAVSIIHGIVSGLKGAASGMAEAMPELIMALINALPGLANDLLDLGLTIVVGIVEGIINSLAAAIGTIIDALLPFLGEIGDAIKNAFEGFFEAMDYYDPAFDEGTIDSDGYLDGMVSEIDARKGEAEEAVSEVHEAVGDTGEALAEKNGLAHGRVLDSSTAEGMADGSGEPVSEAENLYDKIKSRMQEKTGEFESVGGEITENAASGIESKSTLMNKTTGELLDEALNAIANNAGKFNAAGESVPEQIAAGVASGGAKVTEAISTLLTEVNTAAQTASEAFTPTGEAISEKLSTGITSGSAAVSNSAKDVVESAKSAADGAAGGFSAVGLNIARGIASGINSGTPFVTAAARRAVQQAKAAAEAEADIGSPSKLFRDEIGYWIAAGMGEGIEAGADWIDSAVRSVIAGAWDEAQDAIEGIVPDMEDSFALLNGALESQLSALDILLEAKLHAIDSNAETALNRLTDAANSAIDDVAADIEAIRTKQERRQEEKELKEHEERLAELRQKYNEAKAKDKAKAQKDIDKLIADWDEKQLKKQEQAELDKLNTKKKALQEQQKEDEKRLKAEQKERAQKAKDDAAAEKKRRQAQLKRQQDALKEYAKAWEDGLKKLTAEHEKAMQDIANQQEGLFDKLRSGGELTYTTDAGQYRLADLSKDTKAIKSYGEELLKLRDRGVNEELWNEILGMDQAEATKFARKLNRLNDEAYDAYMQSYADKQAAAAEVAESIFGPVREATEADYLAELPDKMEEIGASAMATLAETMGEDGQGVIDAAKTIADGVIAQFERLNSDTLIKGKLMGMIMANNAELAGVVNDAWALQEANAGSSAMRQAMANGVAASGLNSAEREIVMVVNGTEFARATIGDYRAVESQSPQIRSD